jgi:tetratricopeptide (TPR) repeat protein
VALDQLVQNLSQGNFSRSQRDKLYMAMVEATVPQEKYKKAVEYIHEAVDASSDRYAKARLTFLLAQIYRRLDKRAVAAIYYEEVLGYHPPYVMEFNAKLGEASCADLQHTVFRKLEKQLDGMLSDKKNEEYRDQIYFAKGEMYMGVNEPRKACENYALSVAAATTNKAQKAQSALRMGEVQYEVFYRLPSTDKKNSRQP